MKNKSDIAFFFSIGVMLLYTAWITFLFFSIQIETPANAESKQVVLPEQDWSDLPPLPSEEIIEVPVPNQEDMVDVEEFAEEASSVVNEPVFIKEECRPIVRTKRRGIFGLNIFRRRR